MTTNSGPQDPDNTNLLTDLTAQMTRIADALGQMAHVTPRPALQLTEATAYHWNATANQLVPVMQVNRVPLSLLCGIENQRDTLLANTMQFARGYGANNALLWGARGMGKSSLVKSVHQQIGDATGEGQPQLVLVEINREDLPGLPSLLKVLSALNARFIVFCDDLSFDKDETSYKSLKTVLDGGLEGRPSNVIFYATSNRRHLMPREMIENERSTAINPHEAVEEKISLSDRFGLWLGFHQCDQETFLQMVSGYARQYGLELQPEELRARAIEWSATRGARSGRVAIQFIRQIAGETGKSA